MDDAWKAQNMSGVESCIIQMSFASLSGEETRLSKEPCEGKLSRTGAPRSAE